LVFVADSRAEVIDETRRCYALMRRYVRERGESVPLIVQANKQDAAGALSPTELAAQLRIPKTSPVLAACASKDRGVRECFNLVVKAAVRAAQLRVAAQGLSAITGAIETADALFDALLAFEDHLDGEEQVEEEPTDEELDALDDAASA